MPDLGLARSDASPFRHAVGTAITRPPRGAVIIASPTYHQTLYAAALSALALLGIGPGATAVPVTLATIKPGGCLLSRRTAGPHLSAFITDSDAVAVRQALEGTPGLVLHL